MSYVIQRAVRANADAAFIASGDIVNPDARTIGANTSTENLQNAVPLKGSYPERPVEMGPPHEVLVAPVTGGSANRAEGAALHRLYGGGGQSAFADDFWIGETAEIWRIENGVMSLARKSIVTASRPTYVDLAADAGVAPQAGDLLILRKAINLPGNHLINPAHVTAGATVSRNVQLAPFSVAFQGWFADDANDPARWLEESGEWYVEYDLSLVAVPSRQLELVRFSGTAQAFYPIPKAGVTYRAEVELRADAPRTVSFTLASGGARVTAINDQPVDTTFPVPISVTTARQVFSVEFDFPVVPTTSSIHYFGLTLDEAGRYDLFGRRTFDTAAPFGALGPQQSALFSGVALDHIRDPSANKTNSPGDAYDLRGFIVRFLHGNLANTVSLGIQKFWVQPEAFLIDEAAGLVEYLHATSGPWADLRANLGHAAPWTDDLDFLFEISNETWNATTGFSTFPQMTDAATGTVYGYDSVYGFFFQKFIDAMKAAPAWNAAADAKFTFVIGGRFNSEYGDIAATHAPDATIVTRAPYVRGWEVGAEGVTDSPQGFFETLFWPSTITQNRLRDNDGWLATARANGANPALVGGTYEDAISYSVLPSSGSPIPDEEVRFARTRTAGVCWFDKLAAQFSRYSLQSFFTIGLGDAWHSHHPATGEPYPTHLWNAVWNNHCAGALHDVDRFIRRRRTVSVSGATYPLVDEIGCHLTSNGARRSVILVNRNLPYSQLDPADPLYDAADDGVRTVLFVPNWRSAQTATRHTMNGAYDSQVWDASRPDYATFAVSAAPFATTSGAFSVTLPAASAEVFVFEDVA